jgi:hypothetical protein
MSDLWGGTRDWQSKALASIHPVLDGFRLDLRAVPKLRRWLDILRVEQLSLGGGLLNWGSQRGHGHRSISHFRYAGNAREF